MKILVLGAAGPTGRRVVDQALERGHEVVGLVHRAPRRTPVACGLHIVVGDALDPASVSSAIAGCDAVLSVLGERRRFSATRLYSAGATNTLAAMESAGVRRIVCVSAAGVGAMDSPAVPAFFRRIVLPLFARPEYADMERMERVLAASQADWTVVKPLWLRPGPPLRPPRVAAIPFRPARWGLRRADLVPVLLDAVEAGSWVRTQVWVAY